MSIPLLCLPILAQAFTFLAGDTSEARLRTDNIGHHVDMSSTGRLSLEMNMRRTSWIMSYSLGVSQLNSGEPTSTQMLINTFGLTSRLQLTRRTSLTLAEQGMVGMQNLRILAGSGQQLNTSAPVDSNANAGQPPAGGTASIGQTPTVPLLLSLRDQLIWIGSSATTIGVDHRLSRTTSAGAYATYLVGGQLDSSENVLVPDSRSIMGRATLFHTLDQTNTATAFVSGMKVHTDPNADAQLVIAAGGWIHRLSRSTTVTASIGEAFVVAIDRNDDEFKAARPYVFANVYSIGAFPKSRDRFAFQVSTYLAPEVDRFYGGLNEMITTSATATWTRGKLTLLANGYGSNSIGQNGQVSVLSYYGFLESIRYQLDRKHWAASLGTSQVFQHYADGKALPMAWTVFVGLSYVTSPVKF